MCQQVQGLEGSVKLKAPEWRQGKISLPDVTSFKMRGTCKKCLFAASCGCSPKSVTPSPHFQTITLPIPDARFCPLNYCSLQESAISTRILDFSIV